MHLMAAVNKQLEELGLLTSPLEQIRIEFTPTKNDSQLSPCLCFQQNLEQICDQNNFFINDDYEEIFSVSSFQSGKSKIFF
jgi:hypothetical protein